MFPDDPNRRLQVVNSANPSLRMAAAPTFAAPLKVGVATPQNLFIGNSNTYVPGGQGSAGGAQNQPTPPAQTGTDYTSPWSFLRTNVISRNLVRPIVDLGEQGAGTVRALGAGVGGLGRVTAGAITGNPNAENNALNQTFAAMNSDLGSTKGKNGQPGHQKSFFANPEEAQNISIGGLAKKSLKYGTQIAPLVAGPELSALGEGLGTAGRFAVGALAGGGLSTAGDVAAQYADTGKVNPGEAGKAFLTGSALGLAGEGIGEGVRSLKGNNILDTQTTKYLANETDPAAIKTVLSSKLNIDPSEVSDLSSRIAEAGDKKSVTKMVNDFADSAAKSADAAKEAHSTVAKALAETTDPTQIRSVIDQTYPGLEQTVGANNVGSLVDTLTKEKNPQNVEAILNEVDSRVQAKNVEQAPIEQAKAAVKESTDKGVAQEVFTPEEKQVMREAGVAEAAVQHPAAAPGEANAPENVATQVNTNADQAAGINANPDLQRALDEATKPTDTGPVIGENTNTAKGAAQDVRQAFAGEKNRQIVAAGNLAEEVKKLAPDEQNGIYWYREAAGDPAKLQEWLDKANTEGSPLAPHAADIEQAMHLSPEAQTAAAALDKYYQSAGQNAMDTGAIRSTIQDYGNNRLWIDNGGKGTNVTDLLKRSTGHSLERTYETAADAIENGKVPATTNAADLAALHGAEFARVNTTRNLMDNMTQAGIGKWTSPGNIPDGWAKVGTGYEKRVPLQDAEGKPILGPDGNQIQNNSVFVAPEDLAKRMKAITDPGLMNKVDGWRALNKYQGLVKTVDLSYSLFHHVTMAAQLLYQTKGGIDAMRHLPEILNTDSSDFRAMESQWAKNGLMTTRVATPQDIMRNLIGPADGGLIDHFTNIPGIKQALQGAHASSDFLFDKVQRYLKVTDAQGKAEDWIASHPNASPEEMTNAFRGISKEINAAYGGLNWEAMGVSKTAQQVLRTVLLAPDWTISNLALGKYALTEGGPGGAAARMHIATATLGGLAATEALNKAITGHFTNENDPGHKFEVQVAPGVYISLFRGGIGDLIKLGSNVADNGLAGGSARFIQGKTTPLVRTALGLGSNTNYFGGKIAKKGQGFVGNSKAEGAFMAQNLLPVPFGITGVAKYISDAKNNGVNPAAAAALALGVARYSQPKNSGVAGADSTGTNNATFNPDGTMKGSSGNSFSDAVAQGKISADQAKKDFMTGLSKTDKQYFEVKANGKTYQVQQSDLDTALKNGQLNKDDYEYATALHKTLDNITGSNKPPKMPDGMDPVANQYFNRMDKLTPDGKTKVMNGPPTDLAKTATDALNKQLPKGLSPLTATNTLLDEYAKFEKQRTQAIADGTPWDQVESRSKLRTFWSTAAKEGQPDLIRNMYKTSGTQLEYLLKQKAFTKADLDKAVALDDSLYNADLIDSTHFSKKFRTQFGYGMPGDYTSTGGSGGSAGGTAKINAFGFDPNKSIGLSQFVPQKTSFAPPTIDTKTTTVKYNAPPLPEDVRGKPRPLRAVGLRYGRTKINL